MVAVEHADKMSPESEKQGPEYGGLFPGKQPFPSPNVADFREEELINCPWDFCLQFAKREGQQLDLQATTPVGGDGVVASKEKQGTTVRRWRLDTGWTKPADALGITKSYTSFSSCSRLNQPLPAQAITCCRTFRSLPTDLIKFLFKSRHFFLPGSSTSPFHSIPTIM